MVLRRRTHARWHLLPLLLILLFGFWLRIYRLEMQSLRGDEAFAVRYWAQPPSAVLDGLAWVEPHPFGTYLLFWGWKSTAGDSEFAMRLLSGLGSVAGIAAVYALARQGRGTRSMALLAALLWAVNPNLVWHGQDARNYALWAGLSAVALWLLARAAALNRRRDWALYAAVEVVTLYIFFLEAFLLIVHVIYAGAMALRRGGRGWQHPLAAFAMIGVLLVPWLYQAYRLAGSGYGGTAAGSDLALLLNVFVPELLFGEGLSTFGAAVPGLFITLLVMTAAVVWVLRSRTPVAWLALLLLIIPPALLYIVGTRVDVFRPRYLIAITPALVLVLASAVDLRPPRGIPSAWAPVVRGAALALGVVLLVFSAAVTVDALDAHYGGRVPKAPDWRGLAAFLEANVSADDVLVMSAADAVGSLDPAFGYYYAGAFEVLPRAGADTDAEAARLLDAHRTVYLGGGLTQALDAAFEGPGALLGGLRAGVAAYRADAVQPGEFRPLDAELRGGRLVGWDVIGLPHAGEQALVILYWERPPDAGWKVFVHLIDDAGRLVTQQDRYPAADAPRDVYPLPVADVPAGSYTLRVGLYDEATGERAEVRDPRTGTTADGLELGAVEVR